MGGRGTTPFTQQGRLWDTWTWQKHDQYGWVHILWSDSHHFLATRCRLFPMAQELILAARIASFPVTLQDPRDWGFLPPGIGTPTCINGHGIVIQVMWLRRSATSLLALILIRVYQSFEFCDTDHWLIVTMLWVHFRTQSPVSHLNRFGGECLYLIDS